MTHLYLASDFTQTPTALLGAMLLGAAIVGIVAFSLFRAVASKAIIKIESAVTREEFNFALANLVTNDRLKASLLTLEKDVNATITETRHSIRNEMQNTLITIQSDIQKANDAIQGMQKSVSRIEGFMEAQFGKS